MNVGKRPVSITSPNHSGCYFQKKLRFGYWGRLQYIDWKRAGPKTTGGLQAFFIDGHTDFMWPALSSTHGVAGMDLANVTGNGHDKLSLEITILDPDRDPDCKIVQEFIFEVGSTIQRSL